MSLVRHCHWCSAKLYFRFAQEIYLYSNSCSVKVSIWFWVVWFQISSSSTLYYVFGLVFWNYNVWFGLLMYGTQRCYISYSTQVVAALLTELMTRTFLLHNHIMSWNETLVVIHYPEILSCDVPITSFYVTILRCQGVWASKANAWGWAEEADHAVWCATVHPGRQSLPAVAQ